MTDTEPGSTPRSTGPDAGDGGHRTEDTRPTKDTGPAEDTGSPRDTGPAKGNGPFGPVLGALGVVFGDIGTSPLYAMHTVFSIDGNAVKPTPDDVYGVVSLIFWSLTLVVSVKYVLFVLRADNDGEGGIMALAAAPVPRLRGPHVGCEALTRVSAGEDK